MASVETAVQQLAARVHLSPKLATILLLGLLCAEGHALVRVVAPPGTDEAALDDAVRRATREVTAILSRLYALETLVCPALDAGLRDLVVAPSATDAHKGFLAALHRRSHRKASEVSQPRSPPTADDRGPHLPQAVVLPHLDRQPRSAQIALLEATRDGKVVLHPAGDASTAHERQRQSAAETHGDLAGSYVWPAHALLVAVTTSHIDYGGLFRQLADRMCISCDLTLSEVATLEGGVAEDFRSVPLESLRGPVLPLAHPLRTYVADLLSALRLHPLALHRALLSARAQRFLPELVARRAALAGHTATPVDARFVLASAVAHRLTGDSVREAIEAVIAAV